MCVNFDSAMLISNDDHTPSQLCPRLRSEARKNKLTFLTRIGGWVEAKKSRMHTKSSSQRNVAHKQSWGRNWGMYKTFMNGQRRVGFSEKFDEGMFLEPQYKQDDS